MARTFFLSYARDDDEDFGERLIRRLFDEVSKEVTDILGVEKSTQVGFIDVQTPPGDRWRDEILDALLSAPIFVAMMSPRFFQREYCGREWWLFEKRMRFHASQPGGALPAKILPVIWRRPRMFKFPDFATAASFSFDVEESRREALAEYEKRGLVELARKRGTPRIDAMYKTVVTEIAERIVAMADPPVMTPLPRSEVPSFDAVTPKFPPRPVVVNPVAPRRRAIAHFALVAGTAAEMQATGKADLRPYDPADVWGWRPYAPDNEEEIGVTATRTAGLVNLQAKWIPHNASLAEEIRRAERDAAPAVVLVDPWAARVDSYRTQLDDLDQTRFENCAVIVAWGHDDDENETARAEVRQLVSDAFRRRRQERVPSALANAVDSPASLGASIKTALERLEDRLARHRGPARSVPSGSVATLPSVSATGDQEQE